MTQKHLVCVCAALLTPLTGWAQSANGSVTLYGVLDMNLRRVSTGEVSTTKLEPDGILGSRLGVRGERMLDNQLKASFTLESAIKPDTGAGGSATAFWSRRATASLAATSLGELRMGRDTTTTWNNAVAFDHFGTGIGSLSKLFVPKTVNASEIFGRRIDNAVSYFTPDTLGGFFGQLQAAPSEGAVSGKTSGMRLGYASERLIVSAANTQIDVSGGHFKQRAVGASYDFGYVKLLAQQMRSQSVTTTTVDETVLELGAVIPVTTAGTLKLGYAKASGSFEAIKPTVGYVHDLYKDTSVYTTYTYIKNNNDAAVYAVESASAAVAKQRDKSTGFEVGMRYKF